MARQTINFLFLFLGSILLACANVQPENKKKRVMDDGLHYKYSEEELSPITRMTFTIEENLDSIRFIGEDLCGQSVGLPKRFLSLDTAEKYGSGIPYHIEKYTKDDSIHFSFLAISDCCGKAYPSILMEGDSLLITPGGGGGGCDCLCDYSFHYIFPSSYKKKKIGFKVWTYPSYIYD